MAGELIINLQLPVQDLKDPARHKKMLNVSQEVL